jgi:hypothetical protein
MYCALKICVSILNSGNDCYHSVQSVLSSSLLATNKYLNVQNYNFADCFTRRETLSIVVNEECTLRQFEIGVLMRMSGHKKEDVRGRYRPHNETYILLNSYYYVIERRRSTWPRGHTPC